MRLYHFLPAKHALFDISKRRIKVAELDDLNDPFELFSVRLPSPAHRTVWRGFVRDVARSFGVICFSKSWKNPLLWSHYADKHKGICLGFDVAHKYVEPVRYRCTRLPIDIRLNLPMGGLGQDEMREIFYTKFSGWRYEKELRVGTRLSSKETGRYFREFRGALRLREVIVGVRCKVPRHIIEKAVGRLTVRLIRARLAFNTFNVVVDKRGFK